MDQMKIQNWTNLRECECISQHISYLFLFPLRFPLYYATLAVERL